MRKSKLGIVIVALSVMLSGCSSSVPDLEDNTIRRDLTKNDPLLNGSIYSFEINSRIIDAKAGTETVEVAVEGHSERSTFTAIYKLAYKKSGNDTWELYDFSNLDKELEYQKIEFDKEADYETAKENWEEIDAGELAEGVRRAFEEIAVKSYESGGN